MVPQIGPGSTLKCARLRTLYVVNVARKGTLIHYAEVAGHPSYVRGTSKKTDRVIWQVTDTTGVPILGRVQAKLMNYISYPEIHAPQEQEQSPVSQDSLKSANFVHSLKTTNHSLQSQKTAQSLDSLRTTQKTDQTAQEELRAATKAKSSTAD